MTSQKLIETIGLILKESIIRNNKSLEYVRPLLESMFLANLIYSYKVDDIVGLGQRVVITPFIDSTRPYVIVIKDPILFEIVDLEISIVS